MKLLELFRRESKVSIVALMSLAGVAGISNALILAIINTAAENASGENNSSTRSLIMFALVLVIYALTQWRLMSTASTEVEKILDRMRVQLADKVRRCDLQPLEEIGRTLIYASISKETSIISQSALMLIMSGQAAILIFFTAIYVAMLSMVAFGLTIAITTVLAFIHLRRVKNLNRELHETITRENELFETLTHLLEGFKEVRMNRARSNDLFAHFREISESAAERKTRTQTQIARMFIFSQMSFYVLLGVVVFIVPRFNDAYAADVVKITTAVLFLVGPISSLVGTVPNLAAADAACENIAALDASLDRCVTRASDALAPLQTFREISFENVVFHYDDPVYGSTFTVGPLNFTLNAGETVFVSGGNGSGKSTFLKLLTALYYPQQGIIRVDGRTLTRETYESYRGLFATVFSDYHLFNRLYGLFDVADEEIQRRLELIEMEGKTRVVDSRFETLELSGGQRKRVALLVSMLEDRPICVFDEMAADQDPAFRRKFYQEILPLLKSEGRTIVAVTHDDRYFGDADRLLKMEEGRIVHNDHDRG